MTEDRLIQEKLACAYRIAAHLNLNDHTYTHLSARSERGFYIYPFGLAFCEVTADQLLEVTLEGEVLRGNETQYNQTGYVIHGSVYQYRSDIQAIFHLHTPEIVAVSSCEVGLLPLSQWALHFYERISYHDYDSLALNVGQGHRLAFDLQKNYTVLMRNHGSLTCGRTIEEAMFYTYHLQKACTTQCLALSMKTPIKLPNAETCRKAAQDLLTFEKNLGSRDWRAWIRSLSIE